MPHRIAHAKAYPFAVLDHSFMLMHGKVTPLPAGDSHRAGRTPVIATGSNRSYQQLKRKFGNDSEGVPTERAWLADFDVVYAAHITRYGSIPATLQHVAGMRVQLAVNWLTERQLAAMHATEGNYDFVALEKISLETEAGPALGEAHVYVARNGHLTNEGAPIGMREAAAEGRPHTAMNQHEAQSLVHARLGEDADLDGFIRRNIEDESVRRARAKRLADPAASFAWPHCRLP
ncbi:MAG TPA: hypothetical protein VM325_20150 [Alphaproteobacteria bacterium]|nr:hypothetical protein [Alphaproteobacteria bacterium]